MKIAGLSAKAYGKLPNEFTYQGAYAEEEESGYDEFALRHYDPTIGRWLSTDPYDEFASPYVGMGADPVNNVDPDGGMISVPGIPHLEGILKPHWLTVSQPSSSAASSSGSSGGGGIDGGTLNAAGNMAASLAGQWVANKLFPLPSGPDAGQLQQPPKRNSGVYGKDYVPEDNNKWPLKKVEELSDNGCEGMGDPDRNCSLCCLNAFASNLAVLYDQSVSDFPITGSNANTSTAVKPLQDAGLSSDLTRVSPTLKGKRLTSKDGDKFKNKKTKTNITEKLTEMVGNEKGIFIFAVGLAAMYHSTLIVVINDYIQCDNGNGQIIKAKVGNPIFLFVEDGGGSRVFSQKEVENKMKEYYTGASQFYSGQRNIGGRTTSNSDKAMEAWIYQLFTK